MAEDGNAVSTLLGLRNQPQPQGVPARDCDQHGCGLLYTSSAENELSPALEVGAGRNEMKSLLRLQPYAEIILEIQLVAVCSPSHELAQLAARLAAGALKQRPQNLVPLFWSCVQPGHIQTTQCHPNATEDGLKAPCVRWRHSKLRRRQSLPPLAHNIEL